MPIELAYSLLGVDVDASDSEVKRAYRRASSEVHPDKAGDEPASRARAEVRFRQVQTAYETIKKSRKS
jgi:DnaJ-class molecular chaperone